jgi:Carboxypeptidase regulatory-like domain
MNALKTGTGAAGKVIAAAVCLCVILMSLGAGLDAAESTQAHPTTGTIRGVIRIVGTLPKLEPLKINKDEDVCKDVPNESLIVGPGHGLQNVVVSLEGVPPQTTPAPHPVRQVYRITNSHCRFVPHVLVMQFNSDLEISNEDPILHTVKALPVQVNVGLYPGRTVQSQVGMPRLGPVKLNCEIHPWMLGYVFLTGNPYFAVTDLHGEYQIDNVPPGKYRIRVWQELLGEQVSTVAVTAGEVTQLNFKFDAGKRGP